MEPVDMNILMSEYQDLQEKVEKMKKTIERNCDAINNHIKHSINQDLLIDQLHVDLRQARERILNLEAIVFILNQGTMDMGSKLETRFKKEVELHAKNAKTD